MASTFAEHLRLLLSRWIVSPLQGVTFRDWLGVLGDNRFRVSPAFWPRAALTTLTSVSNSLQARVETRRFGDQVAAAEVTEPIFILGHYRSGTTHLHNLLAVDGRFAFCNNYQANFPRTFLTTEAIGARFGAALTMRKRPHDNVVLDLSVPTEDELALCADTLLSPHMGWHFPRREHYYRRYLTFAEASDAERRRWVRSLRTLARKLTVKHGQRLVFKSPCHTARVELILEAFPDARFVHVHRDPYKIYLSTWNMERKVEPLFRYQRGDQADLQERILWRYRTMYEAYFEQRGAIPDGRLVEVAYSELDSEPLATVERIYDGLALADWGVVREELERYVRSLAGYRKNVYPDLDAATKERVAAEWGRCFEQWGYTI